MRYVRREILLSSLVILDLGDIVNYYYREILACEELALFGALLLEDLDLVYPALAEVIDPYEIDAVLAA